MTTPLPRPQPRGSSYPAHYSGTGTPSDAAGFTVPPAEHTGHDPHHATQPQGGHGLMMLVCCIPMVAVVVLLVVSGTASAGALVWALGCVVMMAAMMFLMPGGHGHK
jgi:hypothetical protein